MLRIITEQADVRSELQRIRDRTQDEQVIHKEATVSEVLQAVKRQGDTAVLHYTSEFDHQILKAEELKVTGQNWTRLTNRYPKICSSQFALLARK